MVIANHTVGGSDNGLCGAIVLLQFHNLGPTEYFFELQDVINIGTTESIDALGIIAHHTDTRLWAGQEADDLVLHVVRILILIHENMRVPLQIAFAHLGMVIEQEEGFEQEVVEIHRIGHVLSSLILLIYSMDRLHTLHLVTMDQGGVCCITVGKNQAVLGVRNAGTNNLRLVQLVIQTHLLDNRLDKAARIRRVVNREARAVVSMLNLAAQDSQEHTMESTHRQMVHIQVRSLTYQVNYSRTHLRGGLVRKRERHNLPRHNTLLQKISHTRGQHARLA